jgi:cytochrome P450
MLENGTAPSHVSRDQIFDFDIYADPRVNEDVQGSYAKLLAEAPDVFYTRANGGHWMIKRYQAIAEVVKDPEHFSCREMQIPRVPNPPILIPLSLDPPENIPYRQVLMPLFSPKAVQQLEPKLRHWAQQVVDEVADRGACDFAQDIAARYPVSIFMELMGMPLERLREFRTIADQHFNARTEADFARIYPLIIGLMTELIELRRKQPSNDFISHFLSVDMGGRKMTLDEIQRMCFLLFLGGMDTVTNVTAFAYQQFAQDPALQQRLADHPELIANFVEEALRLYGVVSTPRMVAKDCERFGVSFRAGEMVVCVLSLAGRDDRLNANPNLLDIDRPQKSYLTFSTGPHLCVGHLLARSEIRILTEEWLRRVPRFSAVAGARHKFRLGLVNALESLPLEWRKGSIH